MLTHGRLLKQLKELGYIVNDTGMCYGFASMGAQAILLKDLKTLVRRLKVLGGIEENKLQATLHRANVHRAEKHFIAKKALQETLQKKWVIYFAEDEKIPFEKKLSTAQKLIYDKELSDHLTKADKELDEKDHILLSIQAYFDGTAVYFEPNNYPHLFEKEPPIILISKNHYEEKKPSSNQIFITPENGGLKCKMMKEGEMKEIVIASEKLTEKFDADFYKKLVMLIETEQQNKIKPFITKIKEILFDADSTLKKNLLPKSQNAAATFSRILPDRLLNQKINQTLPAVYTSPSWTGVYNKEKLFSYLKLLENEFKDKKITEPVAFILNNSLHAFSIGWDPETQLWSYVDANYMERITEPMNAEELASAVLKSFSSNGITTAFATSVYGSQSISKQLDTAIKNCQSSEAWHAIHSVNDNELKSDYAAWLFIASMAGDIETVKSLLHSGVKNDESISSNGFNPLHMAAQNWDLEIVNLLLMHGADVEKKTDNGSTALYIAAQSGNFDIVELLLKKNPYIVEGDEESRAWYIDLPGNNGCTPLYAAASNGYIDIMQLLLDQRADSNVMQEHGATPLYIASQNGHEEVVQLLLKEVDDVNHKASFGSTPLFIASQQGHFKVMNTLLEKKEIDLNTAITTSIPILMEQAAKTHRTLHVEQLLKKKRVQGESLSHFSALHAAAYFGHTEAVKTLLSHRADPTIKTDYNISPLELATAMGHHSICDLLNKELTLFKAEKLQKFLHELLSDYKKSVDPLTKRKNELLEQCTKILEDPQDEKSINTILALALCVCLQKRSSWDPRDTTSLGLKAQALLKKSEYAVIADTIKPASNKINYEDMRHFALQKNLKIEGGSNPSKKSVTHFFKTEPVEHFDEIEKHLKSFKKDQSRLTFPI